MKKIIPPFLLFTFSFLIGKAQNIGIGNINPQAALDVQGDLRLRIVTLNLPLGLNNNVDVATTKSSVYNFQTGPLFGGIQISGFAGGVDGRIITLFNNFTSDAVQLYNETSANALSSSVANRILTGSGNTAVIYQNGSVTLRYDGAKQRWTIISSHFTDGLATNTAWNIMGNAGTSSANFIGTTDAQPLIIKVNGLKSGAIDSSSYNTSYGYGSLSNNTNGNDNTAFGYFALHSNTTGQRNTVHGTLSLNFNTSGSYNTANGYGALNKNNTGDANTAIGYAAMIGNTTGVNNTAEGFESLAYNSTGNNNIAVGYLSMLYNTVGNNNTGIGSGTLQLNSTGYNNTASGYAASNGNTTGFSNVAIGTSALYLNADRSNLVAIGDSALYWNGYGAVAAEQGTNNTAVGSKSLYKNTLGNYNTATGTASLKNNTIGVGNTAFGAQALLQNVDGYQNSAFGVGSLSGNISGSGNTAIGGSAMVGTTTGSNNTAVGFDAMNFGATGSNNTAVGYFALEQNNIGGNNTGFGTYALFNNVGGEKNTALGTSADVSSQNLTNATAIGANARVGCNNCMVLGSINGVGGATSNVKVAIGTTTPLVDFHIKQSNETYPVNGGGIRLERQTNTDHWDIGTDNTSDFDFALNGTAKAYINHVSGAYTIASDFRLKKDIATIGAVMPAIMQLQPKTYHYKDNQSNDPLSYGFIAQEVEQLFPAFVTTKGQDGMKAIAYQNLNVVAIKAIQEQQAQIEGLKKDNDALKKLLENFQQQLDELKSLIKK